MNTNFKQWFEKPESVITNDNGLEPRSEEVKRKRVLMGAAARRLEMRLSCMKVGGGTDLSGIKPRRPQPPDELAAHGSPRKKYDVDDVGSTKTKQVPSLLLASPIERNPDMEAVLSSRGIHKRSKEYFKSRVQTTSAIIRNSQSLTDPVGSKRAVLAGHHFDRAYAYQRLRKISPAIEDYSRGLELNPNYGPAYFNRSALHVASNDVDLALADLDEAISQDPKNRAYYHNRASVMRKTDRFMESIDDIVKERRLGKIMGGDGSQKPKHNTQANTMASTLCTTDSMARSLDGCDISPEKRFLFTDPADRSEADLGKWCQVVCSEPFFEPYRKQAGLVQKVASVVRCVAFKKGEMLYGDGDEAESLFIVFDGIVSVQSAQDTKQLALMNDAGELTADATSKYGVHSVFGDGLISSSDRTRTAEAVAKEDTLVLVLRYDDFLSVTSAQTQLLNTVKFKMLEQCNTFDTIDVETLLFLAEKAALTSFPAHGVILSQGEKMTDLCIVRYGIIQVFKSPPADLLTPETHTTDAKEEAAGAQASLESSMGRGSIKKHHSYDCSFKNEMTYKATTPRMWVLQKSWNSTDQTVEAPKPQIRSSSSPNTHTTDTEGGGADSRVLVGVLGSGELYGELAVLDPTRLSTSTLMAYTDVEVMVLSRDILVQAKANFDANLRTTLEKSLMFHSPNPNKLAHMMRDKQQWMNQRLKILDHVKHS